MAPPSIQTQAGGAVLLLQDLDMITEVQVFIFPFFFQFYSADIFANK